MRDLPLKPLLPALLLLGACTVNQEQPLIGGQDVQLTILHTSDIHSRLLPYDMAVATTDRNLGLSETAGPYGGVSRLAALLERERARSYRAIHLDSGDCFQGAPIFNENLGEAEIRWLSMVAADGVVVGNHEFDAGAWNLYEQAARHATYPLLAANYVWRDAREPGAVPLAEVTQPYTVILSKGLKIGVIGMANISSLNSIVAEGNSLGAKALEQNEALRDWIDFVEPQVDLVVVVSHLGLEEDVDLVKGYERTLRHEEADRFVDRAIDPWHLVEDYGNGTGRYFIPGVRGLDVIMGGHLHVVLNPPQIIVDRDGREVVLSHSGAFAKYLGRLDLVLHEDPTGVRGYEVKTHTYKVLPVDATWCAESRPVRPEWEKDVIAQCAEFEHAETLELLEPFILGLNTSLDLPKIFAYTPDAIMRRDDGSSGDSPLGNLTAESMARRKRVDAEIAITNTLGIRDNLYAGPVNVESMFNVFPFENTITVMYLSGAEVQEVLDYVTERSAGRGCQAQAQIAGVRFTMDCGQVRANEHEYACTVPQDCPGHDPTGVDGIAWECLTGRCWAHPARDVSIGRVDPVTGEVGREPLDPGFTYKVAVNDYIASGGSGFRMLKRNTTQFDTEISLRDGLIEYLQNFCTCEQILELDAGATQCNGRPLDPKMQGVCRSIADDPSSASAGRCSCAQVTEALAEGRREDPTCGHVTDAMQAFCGDPLRVPMITAIQDNRIDRRVVDRSVTP